MRTAARTQTQDRMCVPAKGSNHGHVQFVAGACECATLCIDGFHRLEEGKQPCVPCFSREQLLAAFELASAASFASFVVCMYI